MEKMKEINRCKYCGGRLTDIGFIRKIKICKKCGAKNEG